MQSSRTFIKKKKKKPDAFLFIWHAFKARSVCYTCSKIRTAWDQRFKLIKMTVRITCVTYCAFRILGLKLFPRPLRLILRGFLKMCLYITAPHCGKEAWCCSGIPAAGPAHWPVVSRDKIEWLWPSSVITSRVYLQSWFHSFHLSSLYD